MNTTKKILAGLACAFLPIILFIFGSLASTHQTLGNPERVKAALTESGIYSTFVQEGLLRLEQSTSAQPPNKDIPIEDPKVRAIIEQALPPQYLEQQTNGVIDNFYAWLRGDTPNLQFQFDLTEAKGKLADGLATYAEERLNTLPPCTSLRDIPADPNPFTVTCVPPGFDKAAAAQEVRHEILYSKDFLEDPVFSARDLQTNNPQEIEVGNVRINRDLYAQSKTHMLIAGILAVILAAAIIFLSVTRRKGIRRVAIIVIVIGAVSAFFAGVISFLLNEAARRLAESADHNALQQSVVDAVRFLTQDIRNWWLWYGLSLLIVGIVALVVLAVTRRKQPETPPTPIESPKEALQTPPPRKPEDKLKYPRA